MPSAKQGYTSMRVRVGTLTLARRVGEIIQRQGTDSLPSEVRCLLDGKHPSPAVLTEVGLRLIAQTMGLKPEE